MLRRSPRLTQASLAARRANSLKSTGPRTERGKARVALNPLQHGRYGVNLPERLARAGHVKDEAEWRAIRARIAQVFEPKFGLPEPSDVEPAEPQPETNRRFRPGFDEMGPHLQKRMDRLANWVWCSHRNWQEQWGAKLECPLESKANQARLSHRVPRSAHRTASWIPPQIRIHNPWVRLGLVFYAQRRRGWMLQQLTELILAWGTSAARVRAGSTATPGRADEERRSDGAAKSGCATGCATGLPALDLASEMETGLRSQVYQLGRPRFWERMRYCLDREGNYHPELRGWFRQYRRELRAAGAGMWLEPHPVLTFLRQEKQRWAGAGGTGLPWSPVAAVSSPPRGPG